MGVGFIERAYELQDRLRTRLFTWLLAGQFKEFGHGSRITPPFRFWGLHEIAVGENVIINRDCWIQTIPNASGEASSKLKIGSHAGIGMGTCISAAESVLIGEHVLLARNVYISDHSHAYERLDLPIADQGIDRMAPVSIGANTWLGQNVVVLPGVTIGRHCVIGANSVVKDSIPDFSVAVGSPARVVRRFNRSTARWERV